MGLSSAARRCAVLVSAGLIASPFVASNPATADAAVAPADLVAQAKALGKPVEDISQRTETETLYVNPDGSRTLEESAAPVRVRTKTGWSPVDYTLTQNADGSFSPKASPQHVKLSGGGTQPMVALGGSGVSVAFGWPGSLPKPQIAGSHATYTDVLPGVNLVLDVDAAMVSEVLVVSDAKAAANPALQRLTFASDVKGGTLRNADGGGLEIVDASGRAVLRSAAPSMWDSSGNQLTNLADEPGAAVNRRQGPMEGDHVSAVTATASATSLTLTTPASALTGSGVTYPVYIDPTYSFSLLKWAMVSSAWPTTAFYKWTTSNGEGVGYQNFSSPYTTKRLYWQFDAAKFEGATVTKATFSAKAVWSANCTATGVEVWRTAGISSSTTWNSQPKWYEKQDTRSVAAGWSACYPDGHTYDWNVQPAAQLAANAGSSQMALGMKASSETNSAYWKRFLYSAGLSVTYNHPPNTPSTLKVSAGTAAATLCTSTVGTATNPILLGRMQASDMSKTPLMHVTASDPDGDNVHAKYSVAKDGTWLGYTYSATHAAGDFTNQTPIVGLPTNADGTVQAGLYNWNAFAYDSPSDGQTSLGSARSATCYFKVDPTLPNTPAVTDAADGSDPDERVVALNSSMNLTINPNANDTDIVGFAAQWDNATAPAAKNSASTLPWTIAKTFDATGLHTLYVWAYDAAGNRSGAAGVTIQVSDPNLLTATTWFLDEGTGSTAAGSSGANDPPSNLPGLTIGSSLWEQRGVRCQTANDFQLLFTGNTDGSDAHTGVAFTSGNSFSVSAWLDPSEISANTTTAWTLEGVGGTAARLRLNASGNYEFSLKTSSGWQPVTVTTVTEDPASVGLRNVVASYNAVTGSAQLWVDGEEGPLPQSVAHGEATVTGVTGATDLRLGRDLQGTPWRGRIDAVKGLNTSVVSPDDLRHATSWEDSTWSWSMYPQEDTGWGC